MVRAIPEALSVAASDPFGASAVIYALLSGPDDEIVKIQHAHLLRASGEAILRETKWLTPFTKQLPRALRLPLVDLAIPSLRAMSANQYAAFVENVGALIKADQKIDLFEYLISRMIERHLAPTFRRRKPSKTRYTSIASIVDKCGVVLSCLAHYGSPSEDAARQSFERGAALLGVSLQPRMTRADDAGLTQLDSALDVIVLAAPSVKRRVIEACAACVVADGRVAVDEAEFLRAVGDALDCPIPPLAAQADA
jgi:hypothetical protein